MISSSNLNRPDPTSLTKRDHERRSYPDESSCVRGKRQTGPASFSGSRQTKVGALVALLTAACGLLLPGSAAIPSPEKLLPDDTLIMVTVRDFAQMRELWIRCPQARLWNDPAMKPFKDKFLAKWNEEFVKPLERDLGVHFNDYTNLPQGQVTLALTQNGWKGSGDPEPAALLLLDTKNNKDQLKKALADLRKKWVDAGKPIRTERIRGVEFSVVRLSGADVPQTLQKAFGQPESEAQADEKEDASAKKELAVGQFESLLIAGMAAPAIEKVMVHLTGGAMPALGDLAAYEANRLAMFRDAPSYGWINLKSFVDLLNRKPAENDGAEAAGPFAMFDPSKIVTATGLGGLKTLAFNFQNSDEGSLIQIKVGVPEAGRQGLLALFPAHGKESSPPPFVPADVMKFRRWRIEGQKAWATLQKVMNEINPQLLSGLNFLLDNANEAAKQKDPDFDIRRNLFGNLGDDMISYQKAPRGKSPADLFAAPSLFLVSSPQPEQLAAALKSLGVLWSPQGGPPAEREFLGRKIFSVPLPGMPLPTADPLKSGPRTLSCAASGGYVAMSADASILEEYLRSSEGQQKSLRETPGLTDAAAKVGGTSTGWFGYENQAETSRLLFEQLRKLPTAAAIGTNAAPSAAPPFPGPRNVFKDWMDFSLLPPFDKVARYFYFSVYATSANADGLTFKWFAPTPPGLKK